jgi:signal transduction histidine kinase
MINLRVKLALFNLFSKLAFTALFLILLPYIIERINLRQVDNDLIQKREQVIEIIARTGIEPFITSDSGDAFGSYNLLKEEFISLEKIPQDETLNYIEVTPRLIEEEEINYRVLNYSFMVDGQNYLLEIGKSLTSILYARKNFTKVMLVFLVLIIIITFLTDLQYTRFILHPFGKITSRLRGISDPSLFDKTPVKTTTSDFYQLDNALRSLMERIDELFRKEKEITVDISHELMTPISVLRSKLENMLLREDMGSDMQTSIEESLKTLHRLQSLVNSLLMIARIESRQYVLDETFPVAEVLKEIISEILPVAEDAGIMLTEELNADISFAGANKPLIFSMFYNIVNNAVKNTPSGGKVLVKSLVRQSKFIVTVSDTGKGMNEIQMKNLFLRFKTRIDTGENGTGIGLAIAKTIADLHKIEVSVTSEIEKGTKFSFIFPENS